jgi:hypothetical protein
MGPLDRRGFRPIQMLYSVVLVSAFLSGKFYGIFLKYFKNAIELIQKIRAASP